MNYVFAVTIQIPAPTAENLDNEEEIHITVPQTDLFETMEIPDLCENKDNCVNDRSLGCFLSLLKRKEIVRMDSKYLIKVILFHDKIIQYYKNFK